MDDGRTDADRIQDEYAANGIFEKFIPTAKERAEKNLPNQEDMLRHGYVTCAQPGELAAYDPESREYGNCGIVGLGVDVFVTKEGHLHPGRLTLVSTHGKYIYRAKVKPEGHVLDYGNTGLDQQEMSHVTLTRAEMTKKVAKLISTSTIILSFDPAQHLHLMKIVHYRIIDVRDLFQRDLKLGLRIDKENLMKRYFPNDYYKWPEAILAVALAMQFFAAFNWLRNVEHMSTSTPKGPNKGNLPLFPMLPAASNLIEEHTSKQLLIKNVHSILAWKYRAYFIRPFVPVLIGEDIIRVHVKKWVQLNNIVDFIGGLSNHIRHELGESTDVNHEEFRLMSLPISMKSKAQMKGFFVYIGFGDKEKANIAMKYFDKGREIDGQLVRFKCEKATPHSKAAKAMQHSQKKDLTHKQQSFNILGSKKSSTTKPKS